MYIEAYKVLCSIVNISGECHQIDSYNFDLYCFKVDVFDTQCRYATLHPTFNLTLPPGYYSLRYVFLIFSISHYYSSW